MTSRSSFYGEPKRLDDSTYEVETLAGSLFSTTLTEAIALAKRLSASVRFEFNGVVVTVAGDSDAEIVARDWQRALSGYIDKAVGPYPPRFLMDWERESDARIERENERKRQEAHAKYEAEAKAKREAVEARLHNAPAMEFSDEAVWQEFVRINTDGYSRAVVTYSERWARLMQLEMSQGKPLSEIAKETSDEADVEGITGFQYGCAVSALARCWRHGEELRCWHNLKTQIRDEGERANASGGVLNPAILSMGKPAE